MAPRVVLGGVLFVAPWLSTWLIPASASQSDRLTISLILQLTLALLPTVPEARQSARARQNP